MRLHTRCRNLRLTKEIREQVRSRLAFALARFGHQIEEVTASLADLNGRKGGMDKQCRVVVKLHPNSKVTIEETDSNVFAAIARAADRAKNTVGRTLKRRHDARINRNGLRPATDGITE